MKGKAARRLSLATVEFTSNPCVLSADVPGAGDVEGMCGWSPWSALGDGSESRRRAAETVRDPLGPRRRSSRLSFLLSCLTAPKTSLGDAEAELVGDKFCTLCLR